MVKLETNGRPDDELIGYVDDILDELVTGRGVYGLVSTDCKPVSYTHLPKMYTASVAIKNFADSTSTTDYGAMFAMSTLSLIPVFLIFLFFNRYLGEGISTSGIKG